MSEVRHVIAEFRAAAGAGLHRYETSEFSAGAASIMHDAAYQRNYFKNDCLVKIKSLLAKCPISSRWRIGAIRRVSDWLCWRLKVRCYGEVRRHIHEIDGGGSSDRCGRLTRMVSGDGTESDDYSKRATGYEARSRLRKLYVADGSCVGISQRFAHCYIERSAGGRH